MARLTAEQLRALVSILAPHLRTPEQRDDALASAFHGLPIFDRISPDAGDGRSYARRLLQALDGNTALAYAETPEGRRFSLDVYLATFAADKGGDVAAQLAPLLDALSKRGEAVAASGDPAPPDAAQLEVMVRELPELGPAYFERGTRASRSVAYLEVTFPRGRGNGTGFLIGDQIVLTCHHVLHDHDRGDVRATTVRAWFDHEMDEHDQPRSAQIIAADVETIVGDRQNDWAVVRLSEAPPGDYEPLPLSSRQAERGERALIVQHIDGKRKSLEFGANPIWYVDDRVVRYVLNTEKGSSGAPVFDDHFQVIALHYKGIERERWLPGSSYNEGINILRVREGLERHGLLPAAVGGALAPAIDGADDTDGDPVAGALESASGESAPPPPPDALPPALRPIRDAIFRGGTSAAIDAAAVSAAARHAPNDWTEYRLRRVAHWKQPKYNRNVDRRFTRLTLMLDQGEHAEGQRWSDKSEYDDLRVVLETVEGRFNAVVVLGSPGAGKTTLLRRLELDWAARALDGDAAAPLTFFVPLGEFRDRELTPRAWLGEMWSSAYPHLSPLEDTLLHQPFILLLDGLNELPHAGPEDFAERVEAWRRALAALATERPGVRFVFSCRSLDYSASLSTDDAQVPHVRIEPLDDDQVQDFLTAYLPDATQAAHVWRQLEDAPTLLDLCRTPYYLNLLVEQIEPGGVLPNGRSALFTGFVRRALKREIEAEHARFKPGTLLTARDIKRCGLGGPNAWASPHDLPSEGALVSLLEALSDDMQRMGRADDGSQVVVAFDEALELLSSPVAADALRAGADLGVLDIDEFETTVRFAHQLMQEYFAARVMARQPDAALVFSPWRADQVSETLAATLVRIAEADPLPPLPSTGWEETAVMAAEMMRDADADRFVAALADANIVVAARCAASPAVHIGPERRADVRRAVAARMADPSADLRARIAAGLALGSLGDPVDLGFERRTGPHGNFLLPPLVAIPAGRYPIGSKYGWPEERPAHAVELAAFDIGRYPVTNAEFACFVEAGGYSDERWWETEDARAWLRGDPALVEATREVRRAEWAEYPKDDEGFAEWCRVRPNLTQSSKEWFDWFRNLSAEALEGVLDGWYPAGAAHTQPAHWENSAFNNFLQPVVGVSWFEARSYAAWLAAQTGRAFALPSEAHLEAATRGARGRTYAYGPDHDTAHCNTYETHIRQSTPVGVFPGGVTPEGAVDLTGNVIEWTRNLWGTNPTAPDAAYCYPFEPDDASREAPVASVRHLRVLRGGSWYDGHDVARAACRVRDFPDLRYGSLGFRLVVASPTSR